MRFLTANELLPDNNGNLGSSKMSAGHNLSIFSSKLLRIVECFMGYPHVRRLLPSFSSIPSLSSWTLFFPSALALKKCSSLSLMPLLLVLYTRVHGGDIVVCSQTSIAINCILTRIHLRGVLHLNFYLLFPLITGCINGYNSSLVNGMALHICWMTSMCLI